MLKWLPPALLLFTSCSPPDEADGLVQLTVANGADVQTSWVSRETVAQMLAARSARGATGERQTQALTVSSPCVDEALLLSDAASFQGNILCLGRQTAVLDVGDLSGFFRKLDKKSGINLHWGGAVRSFYAGTDPGYFRKISFPYDSAEFASWERRDSVSTLIASAYLVALHHPNHRPGATIYFYRDEHICPPTSRVTITAAHGGPGGILDIKVAPGPGRCFYVKNDDSIIRWGEPFFLDGPHGRCVLTRSDVGSLESRSFPIDPSRVDPRDVVHPNTDGIDLQFCSP